MKPSRQDVMAALLMRWSAVAREGGWATGKRLCGRGAWRAFWAQRAASDPEFKAADDKASRLAEEAVGISGAGWDQGPIEKAIAILDGFDPMGGAA